MLANMFTNRGAFYEHRGRELGLGRGDLCFLVLDMTQDGEPYWLELEEKDKDEEMEEFIKEKQRKREKMKLQKGNSQEGENEMKRIPAEKVKLKGDGAKHLVVVIATGVVEPKML